MPTLNSEQLANRKSLVALEGIEHGNKFFTSNDDRDPTKLHDGTIAYKILGYADTVEEAQHLCGIGLNREDDIKMIADYLFTSGRELLTREDCDKFAKMLV